MHIMSDHDLVVLMRILLSCLNEIDMPSETRERWREEWSKNLASHVHGMLDLSLEKLIVTTEDRALFRMLMAAVDSRIAAFGDSMSTAELNAFMPRMLSFTKPVETASFHSNIDHIVALIDDGID